MRLEFKDCRDLKKQKSDLLREYYNTENEVYADELYKEIKRVEQILKELKC